MLLRRNKTNILRIEGIIIGAGLNDISEEKAEILKKNPVFQSLLDNGVHQIVEKPALSKNPEEKPSKTSDITEMKVSDAVPVIQGILSIQQLEDMKNREMAASARKTVLSAIDDQIADIKNIPDDE